MRRYLCILANDMFAAKIKCIKVEDDIAVKLEEKVQSRVDHALTPRLHSTASAER